MLMAIINAPQAVAENGTLNLITTYGQCGCVTNNAGAITLAQGAYLINVSVSMTGDGTATIQLLNNGTAVQGASGTTTLTTGNSANVSFSSVVCVNPSCRCVNNATTLQLQVLRTDIAISSAVVTVVKCHG